MCPALAAGIFLEQPEPNKPGVNLPSTIQHKQLLTSLSNNTTTNTGNINNSLSSTTQHTADSSPPPPLPLHLIASTESSTTSNAPSSSLSLQPFVSPSDVLPESIINDVKEATSGNNNTNNHQITCNSSSTCKRPHNDNGILHSAIDPLHPETPSSTTTTLTQQQAASKPLRLGVYDR